MKFALHRPYAASGKGRSQNSPPRPDGPAQTPDLEQQTIGDRLRSRHGKRFCAEWLSEQLGCSREVAVQLADSLMPDGSPQFVENSLQTTARFLEIAPAKLIRLVTAPAVTTAAPRARSVQVEGAAGAGKRPPRQVETTVGTMDGVRVITRRQPTVVYKKSRKID